MISKNPGSFVRRAFLHGTLLASLILAPGCGGRGEPAAPPPPATPPVLLLGIDGLEWRVMLPMLRAGELPALAGLMSRGAFGKLETIQPTLSPLVWTTIATGKLPAKHGIVELLKPDAGGGMPRIYNSTDRTTKALWNMLTERGLIVDSLGWWKTFPVEEVRGVMVPQLNLLFAFDASGLGTFQASRAREFHGIAYPDSFEPKVRAAALEADAATPRIAESIFGRFRHPHSPLGQYSLPRLKWVITMDAAHIRLARELLAERKPYDLMLFFMRGTDVVGHAFWRFLAPGQFQHKPTQDEMENYGGFIPSYYRYADAAIGSLLEASGPETTVIVVSDHGMGPTHQDKPFSTDYPNPEHMSGDHENAPPGVLIAAGPGISPVAGLAFDPAALAYETLPTLGSVTDVTPTILALKGLPIGEDMDGKILISLIDPQRLNLAPPGRIESWDTQAWLRGRHEHRLAPEEEKDRIEELRSLGYIH